MKITLISDTHTKHMQIVSNNTIRSSNQQLDLPGGDLLIHAGDFMNSGYNHLRVASVAACLRYIVALQIPATHTSHSNICTVVCRRTRERDRTGEAHAPPGAAF